MNKMFLWLVSFGIIVSAQGQSIDKIIKLADVTRIESVLSADSMQGRRSFTPASDKAADFISCEFNKIGLTNFTGANCYKQTFTMVSLRNTSVSATVDGIIVDAKNVVPFTTSILLNVTQTSDFKTEFIKQGANFRNEITSYLTMKENAVVFVDMSFAPNFARLNRMRQQLFKSEKSVIFILGNYTASKFEINLKQDVTEQKGSNVVGIIPGKNKKDEMVIFSGHYDHLGIGKANGTDSIYNGANDDASGITAIIEMARYYKAAKSNERTLVFAAFTAEEIGGFGSQYFSKQLDADKVIAMFNMEMIGTESKWGKNSAYITGFEKTDLGFILQKNLTGSNFSFHPDPYIDQNLFYRSDNATLARLGVPAHTISTSKMDDEPNYHKLSDEVGTLDLNNMTEIIKSVIVSAKSIVDGKDTPTRVKTVELTR